MRSFQILLIILLFLSLFLFTHYLDTNNMTFRDFIYDIKNHIKNKKIQKIYVKDLKPKLIDYSLGRIPGVKNLINLVDIKDFNIYNLTEGINYFENNILKNKNKFRGDIIAFRNCFVKYEDELNNVLFQDKIDYVVVDERKRITLMSVIKISNKNQKEYYKYKKLLEMAFIQTYNISIFSNNMIFIYNDSIDVIKNDYFDYLDSLAFLKEKNSNASLKSLGDRTLNIKNKLIEYFDFNHKYYVNNLEVLSPSLIIKELKGINEYYISEENMKKASNKAKELRKAIFNLYESNEHVKMFKKLINDYKINVKERDLIVFYSNYLDKPIYCTKIDLIVSLNGKRGLIILKHNSNLNYNKLYVRLLLQKLAYEHSYDKKIDFLACIYFEKEAKFIEFRPNEKLDDLVFNYLDFK